MRRQAFGIRSGFAFIQANLTLSAATQREPFRLRLQQALRDRLGEFAPSAADVWVTRCTERSGGQQRRRLLATDYELDVLILVNFTTYDNDVMGTYLAQILANVTDDAEVHSVIAAEFAVLNATYPQYADRWARVQQHWEDVFAPPPTTTPTAANTDVFEQPQQRSAAARPTLGIAAAAVAALWAARTHWSVGSI